MRNIWKNKSISLKVKMRLYEAIIISTLLYSADVWPLNSNTNEKAERCSSQMAKEHLWYFLEGQSNK